MQSEAFNKPGALILSHCSLLCRVADPWVGEVLSALHVEVNNPWTDQDEFLQPQDPQQ